MIPAERKIVIDNIDIDILIPNSKNLKTDKEKSFNNLLSQKQKRIYKFF